MRDEYDFTPEELRNGIQGVNLVPIDPALTEIFSDAEAVNQALRAMASVIRAWSVQEHAA